jgi:hypothetical protein
MIPNARRHVEPFLCQAVAVRMFLRKIDTEGIVFRLVPTGHHIQTQSTATQLIRSGKLLGSYHRVDKRRMHRGKNIYSFRMREQAGRPSNCFEHATVKIGFPAVSNPPRDGQKKFNACFIGQFRQMNIIVPGIHPPFRNLGYGHPSRTVGRKKTEL